VHARAHDRSPDRRYALRNEETRAAVPDP